MNGGLSWVLQRLLRPRSRIVTRLRTASRHKAWRLLTRCASCTRSSASVQDGLISSRPKPSWKCKVGPCKAKYVGWSRQKVHRVHTMIRKVISFGLFTMVLFAASVAHAGPKSRLAYAQQCAAEMGTVPSLNCMQGVIIPITKNGVPLSRPSAGEDCDKPIQLGLTGASQCVPYSRFIRLNTGDPNVETVAICRKYAEDASGGLNDPHFTDVAMIQHNKRTGNTCYYQSHLHQHLDGRRVPSPQEDSSAANSFWLEPRPGGPDGITCTNCHDADPFIWSPYIVQKGVADPSNWDPLGPWNSNFQDLFGSTTKTFRPHKPDHPDQLNGCVLCHRIGNKTCGRKDVGTS